MLRLLQRLAHRVMKRREPDFTIGPKEDPYMLRWWVIPRNRIFNIYLHRVLRSDSDEALHDHPWVNMSLVLEEGYIEHRIRDGGIHMRSEVAPGSGRFRLPSTAHRLELHEGKPALTLFFTGPVVRSWGFHCPKAGWRHWKDFTAPYPGGNRHGRGCGEGE